MKRKLLISLCLSLSVLGTAHGAPITLRQAVKTALERNPELRQLREKIAQHEAGARGVFSPLLPNASAHAQAAYNKDAINVSSPKFGGSSYNQYNAGFKVLQPIIQLGALSGVEASKSDIALAEIDAEIAARDLTAQVIQAYFSVILGENKMRTLLESERLGKENLATAQRRYSTGRSQLIDVLQAQTTLALLAPKIAQARTDIRVAAAELSNQLGDPNAESIEVAGSLEMPVTLLPATAAYELTSLPDYRRVDISGRRLASEREATLGKNWPSVNAFANWDRSTFVKSELLNSDSTSWSLGVQLTVPIFSGLSSVYERQQFASRAAQVEHERAVVANKLTLDQVRSREALDVAILSIRASIEAYDLARRSLNEAQKNYRLSTIDLPTLLNVQSSFLTARGALDEQRFAYLKALVNYDVASGVPLDSVIDLAEKRGTSS